MHPQMQEVFIRQFAKIAQQLVDGAQDKRPWPVQFVVSTHSSHIANAAGFESIRYLGSSRLAPRKEFGQQGSRTCARGSRTSSQRTKFLHQYMTLTRCDLSLTRRFWPRD
ncbi:MAG: hypothetical protein R3E56_05540 [Burkholderiaceae bacterium]